MEKNKIQKQNIMFKIKRIMERVNVIAIIDTGKNQVIEQIWFDMFKCTLEIFFYIIQLDFFPRTFFHLLEAH